MRPWKKLNSKYVIRDRWLTVRADTYETPAGDILDPYYLLEYSDWIHVLAFDDEMNVLLIRLYRPGTAEVTLEIPSGTVEEGESPKETVRRELAEETGCTCRQVVMLGGLTPNSATHTNRSQCAVAYGCRKTCEPCFDPGEQIETEWVSVDELLRRIDEGEFYQALQMAAIFLALRHAGLPKHRRA